MHQESGRVSVSTENIFPIIRKWLYSDRDIFLRELVSNASDAISKLKRLADLGEAKLPEDEQFRIDISFDSEAGELVIADNGIGMTTEEIRKYINQIAFSGVMDFVEKYKDKGAEEAGIIGHFGLGFYSAFMVSEDVRIDTLSWQPDAQAASWQSSDGMEYVMDSSDYDRRGSRITLKLSEEGKSFLTASVLRDILDKYCNFMPYPIYFRDLVEERKAAEEAAKKAEEAAAETDKNEDEEKAAEINLENQNSETPVNNVSPLWLKNPSDCTDEEYKEFYRTTFRDFREPLFWIHLNMDYPFKLKGILYFPQTDNMYETLEGRIKIYYNQVFVADNIKEIIPEFLFLLKGCIDCPDLPLNVSRSFLQNDDYVSKLSSHIIRKVSEKLNKLFKDERESYESYWQDIGVFVKYGMLRDEKFYDRVKDIAVLKTVNGKYLTLTELPDEIYYTPDAKQQVAYIQMAQARGLEVVVMDHEIDNHFMSMVEYKNSGKKFKRVDAELGGKESESDRIESYTGLFRQASGDEKLEVKVQALGENALPAMILESEENRRMQEMRKQFEKMQGKGDNSMDFDSMFPLQQTLVVNEDHPLVSKLHALGELSDKKEKAEQIARQVYDLARLGHGSLAADDMAEFLKRSSELLQQLANQ
jgi:molecular chaperone HtpG